MTDKLMSLANFIRDEVCPNSILGSDIKETEVIMLVAKGFADAGVTASELKDAWKTLPKTNKRRKDG